MTEFQRQTNDDPGSTIDAEVAELLDQYLTDRQRGTAADREKWLGQHPQHADRLAECLDAADLFGGGVTGGFDLPGEPVLPESIGDFEILRELGRGGMGVVYEAREKSLDRIVALKVMRFGIVDPKALDRFRREAETAGALHHTNIVPVYATGREGDTSWYAMQRIEGESLAARLDRTRKQKTSIDIEDILDVGIQAADALDHAHERDVVHRDVKPANLILDLEDRVWLTDFGLARRLVDAGATMTGAILGTPRYMSPEQADLRTTDVDHRSDIYSLGATLYEMSTGRPPFEGNDPLALITKIRYEETPGVRTLRPDLPLDLEVVLHKAMEKEPKRRYQSAAEFADDLRAIRDDHAIQARPLSILEKAARFGRKHQSRMRVVAAAMTATTVLIAALLYGLDQWNESRTGTFRVRAGGGPYQATITAADKSTLPNDTLDLTFPMQNQHRLIAGDYDVMVAPRGRWSRTLRMPVTQGIPNEYRLTNELIESREISIEDAQVITVAGDHQPAVIWRRDGQMKKLAWHDQDDWQLDVSSIDSKLITIDASGKAEGDTEQISINYSDQLPSPNYHHGHHFIDDNPLLTQAVSALRTRIDLDGDNRADSLVAATGHQALMAVDHTGTILWSCAYRFAGLPSQTSLPDPSSNQNLPFPGVFDLQNVGDLDSDGIDDVFVMLVHFPWAVQTNTCLMTVSGKTGDPIDTFPMAFTAAQNKSWPADGIFHPDRNQYRSFDSWSLTPALFRRTSHRSVNDFNVNQKPRSSPIKIAVPSPPVIVREGQQMTVAMLTGDKFDIIPWADPGSAVTVQLLNVPARAPAVVHTASGPLFVFHGKDEIQYNSSPAPGTDFAAFDRQGNLAWTALMESVDWKHSIGRNHADWPLIVDANGDGNDEIILPRSRFRNGVDLGISMWNASDGKPVWDEQTPYSAIHSADNALARIVLSDDLDGDGWKEIATASFAGSGSPDHSKNMASGRLYVYVDWISGRTGQRLAWARHRVPIVGDQISVAQVDSIRSGLNDAAPGTVEIDLVNGDDTLDVALESTVVRFHPSEPGPTTIAAGLDVCPTPGDTSSPVRVYRRRGGPFGVGQDHLVLLRDPHPSPERLGETNLLATWKSASGNQLVATSGLNPTRTSVFDAGTRLTQWTSERTVDSEFDWIPVRQTDGTIDFIAQQLTGIDIPPRLVDGDDGTEITQISGPVGGSIIWNRLLDNGRSLLIVGDGSLRSEQFDTVLGRPSNAFRMSLVSTATGQIRWSVPFLVGAARINRPRQFDHLALSDVNGDGVVDVIGTNSQDDFFLAAWDGSNGEKLWEHPVFQRPTQTDYWMPFTTIVINAKTYVAYFGRDSEDDQVRRLVLLDPTGNTIDSHALEKPEQIAIVKNTYSHRNFAIANVTSKPSEPMIAISRRLDGQYQSSIFRVSENGLELVKDLSRSVQEAVHGMWFRDVDGDGVKERLLISRAKEDGAASATGTGQRQTLSIKCYGLLDETPKYDVSIPNADEIQSIQWQEDEGVVVSWLRIANNQIVAMDWTNGKILAQSDERTDQSNGLLLLCSVGPTTSMMALPTLDGIEFRELEPKPFEFDSGHDLRDDIDPRRIQRLLQSVGGDAAVSETLTGMIRGGFAFGILFVLPIWYFRRAIRNRRWSLAWMLALPAIVGLWMIVWQSEWLRQPDLTINLFTGVGTWMCGAALVMATKNATDSNGHSIRLMLMVGTPFVFLAFLLFSYLQRSDLTLHYTLNLADLARVALISFVIVAQLYWILRIPVSIGRVLGRLVRRRSPT